MCTIQSIKDAIRENCQSQYDMESTDIDQVLQTLPFSEQGPFSQAEAQETLRPKNRETVERHNLCEKDCGVFSCGVLGRSEVNARISCGTHS